MVNFKVRSFYEKDTGTAGADVIIYDDVGDVVDTLLITTESTYNDLVEQLEGIDEKYLDRTDVLNILQNTSNEIVAINATTLNGLSADFYAKNNHNHDAVYAPLPHVNVQSTEGVMGHVKIINNVTRDSFVNGEALAAYQGKLLNDRISSVDAKLGTCNNTDIATYDTQCLKAYVNPYLRVVYATFNDIFNYTTSKKNTYIATGEIVKSGYRPKREVHFVSSPYTHGRVTTDGKIYGRSIYPSNKSDLAVKGSCGWVY